MTFLLWAEEWGRECKFASRFMLPLPAIIILISSFGATVQAKSLISKFNNLKMSNVVVLSWF
jgi:hypothetical protein